MVSLDTNSGIGSGIFIDSCQFCGNGDLYGFLSLGDHPNPDHFLSEEQLEEPEPLYPLDVHFCDECKLVQLGYAADPEALFTDEFVYTTGTSGELVRNFQSLAEKTTERFNLSSEDIVIDIGSNDGTFLANYLSEEVRVLGIDPSRAAELAAERNVPTLRDFFNEDTAQRVLNEYGGAKVITAANVFAHVRDLDSFMKGIKILLSEKGVFIEESHHLESLVLGMQYDSIYAEHLRYYSLKPLITLFDKFDMDVFDVERIRTHGGSLRVYACNAGEFPISENVYDLLEDEQEKGLYSRETFDAFAERVEGNRKKLRSMLLDIKEEGNRIVGMGAPAKGNTLLNYCGIGKETLDYLTDQSDFKVDRYSPGMHIPIVRESRLAEDQPEYALLLVWNLRDMIIPKFREKGYTGKIIVPNPEPEIIY